eukprot:6421333-Amphidinium_carterae.1
MELNRPLYYSSPSGEVRVSSLPCYTDEQREARATSSTDAAGGDMDVTAGPAYDVEVTFPTRLRESEQSRTNRLNEL